MPLILVTPSSSPSTERELEDAVTVTMQVVLRPVATEVHKIVAVPALMPFTLPVLVTVAIFVLELSQVLIGKKYKNYLYIRNIA